MSEELRLSYIIPAMNEEKYIGECIDSIKKQKYCHEVILVDGGSEDGTREMAEEKGAKVVSDPGKNAALARNIGAKEAEGNIYCFVDSDTTLPLHWSEEVEGKFRDKEVVAVGGPLKPKEPRKKDVLMYYITTDLLPTFTSWFGFHQFQGPNMAFRSSAFEEIGGFNEDLGILEDNEIANRIRCMGKVVWDRKAPAYEYPRRFQKKGYLSETLKYWKAYFKIYVSKSKGELKYEKCSDMD